jgi:hypothetical protein
MTRISARHQLSKASAKAEFVNVSSCNSGIIDQIINMTRMN